MASYPTRTRLPPTYSREIGRVITRWAFLESQLRKIDYTMACVGPKIGRLTIREPRAVDHITMIEDVMGLLGLTTTVDTTGLKNGLSILENYRDKVAHGVWVKHPKSPTPVLQDVKGSYQPAPQQKKVKARIEPRAVGVTIANLRNWADGISHATKLIQRMGREIHRQLLTSPCKCCGQPLPKKSAGRQSQKKATR